MASLKTLLAKQLPAFNPNGVATAGKSKPIRKEPVLPKVDKLRTAACNYPCVLCGKAKRFTIAAHCNDITVKGIGIKATGFLIAYVCSKCHDLIDGRAGNLTKPEKRLMWLEAYWLTVQIWFRDRLVVLA